MKTDQLPDSSELSFDHASVMLEEVMRMLEPRPGGRYLDVTLGGAGHSEAILHATEPDGTLVGIDRDPRACEYATRKLGQFGARASVHRGTMSEAWRILREAGLHTVDGLIADLGVSSPQIEDPLRGMSFRAEGPLDMRMDPDGTHTVYELLRALSERDLADVIYQYGEERASRPIARSIKNAVERGTMETTRDLAGAVYRILGPPRRGRGIDPATRTFQALRIAVNDELGELTALLAALPEILSDGGRAVVISFHSLEDAKVKRAFRNSPALEALTKKPMVPTDEERARNVRARSAKLRVARRRPRGTEVVR